MFPSSWRPEKAPTEPMRLVASSAAHGEYELHYRRQRKATESRHRRNPPKLPGAVDPNASSPVTVPCESYVSLNAHPSAALVTSDGIWHGHSCFGCMPRSIDADQRVGAFSVHSFAHSLNTMQILDFSSL